MIDAHVHFEKGNYYIDWIQEFIEIMEQIKFQEQYFKSEIIM